MEPALVSFTAWVTAPSQATGHPRWCAHQACAPEGASEACTGLLTEGSHVSSVLLVSASVIIHEPCQILQTQELL